jgi:hypothetical protein
MPVHALPGPTTSVAARTAAASTPPRSSSVRPAAAQPAGHRQSDPSQPPRCLPRSLTAWQSCDRRDLRCAAPNLLAELRERVAETRREGRRLGRAPLASHSRRETRPAPRTFACSTPWSPCGAALPPPGAAHGTRSSREFLAWPRVRNAAFTFSRHARQAGQSAPRQCVALTRFRPMYSLTHAR